MEKLSLPKCSIIFAGNNLIWKPGEKCQLVKTVPKHVET